jgi:DNA-binding HxlR family transcriptional regulator
MQPTMLHVMPTRKSLDHLDCSVANTVDVIGDRWSLLILRDAFFGVRRFDDFQKDLAIARNVLADRLQGLVDREILTTRPYQDNPPRNEYVLTDKGRDLFDVLMALWRFGDKWEPASAKRVAIHDECGHETHIVASCAHCGGELTRRNIRVVPALDVVQARVGAS